MNPHEHGLSDEAFADLVAHADTSSLPATSAEAEALRSALHSYRTETLQWAERRSATQPSLQRAARRSRAWAAVPQWSLAAVAVISIAAGVARVYDRSDAGQEDAAITASDAASGPAVAGASAADIAADNRLLSSIDQALSYHAATPVDGLGLKSPESAKPVAPGVID